VKDLTPSEAFDQLLNLPEVQASMTALNLKRRAPDVSPAKLSSSKFSVNLEGMSLREALDRIAQESHLEIWIFRNYPNGFFSISSIER
jgi:type II secretory pathway component GspD/PulD (secretin)